MSSRALSQLAALVHFTSIGPDVFGLVWTELDWI